MIKLLKIFNFLLAFFLLQNSLNSQVISRDRNTWEQVISLYREELFTTKQKEISKLKELFDSWKEQGAESGEIFFLTLNLLECLKIHNNSISFLQKQAKNFFPNNPLGNLTEPQIQIVMSNDKLLNLIHINALEIDYPFELKSDSDLFFELSFIDMKADKNSFGEVGAGYGIIGMLMNMRYPETHIFLNEINSAFKNYQLEIIKDTRLISEDDFTLIEGTKKSAKTEGLDIDVIYLRNCFHHFTHKTKMLSSIVESLNKDGEIIILEGIKNDNSDKYTCKLKMQKEQIVQLIKDADLVIVQEVELNDILYLRIKKEKSR